MEHKEEWICPKGPWLGATAEPSQGTPSFLSSWRREKCLWEIWIPFLSGFKKVSYSSSPLWWYEFQKRLQGGIQPLHRPFFSEMELEPFTYINWDLQKTIKKPWHCNPRPREEMGPVQCFLRQPIIFSDCRVVPGGCHKMCRIALILCRHCSALTFVSSQSVILQVNLVCKCFPSSTARCICHINCVTLVPSLKIQSFYSCWYFFFCRWLMKKVTHSS